MANAHPQHVNGNGAACLSPVGSSVGEGDIDAFRTYLMAHPEVYRSMIGLAPTPPAASNSNGKSTMPQKTHKGKNDPPHPSDSNGKEIARSAIKESNSGSSSSSGSCFMGLLKFVLFTAWLALPLTALGAAFCLRHIHDNYFAVFVQRAERTDNDLLDEFTYYGRTCSAHDVTANLDTAHQLVLSKNTSDSASRGVDIMMKHGALLMPQVLSPSTIRDLRNFIVRKNIAVKGTPAEFPVSQGHNRISYGIEAAEDETVIRALREIYDDDRVGPVLAGLVGHENPALTEITAITAAFGAPDQVWHPDVKPDGNALQFGRTYSHSYSLFLPLQDTTREMGATHLCPGTHYCADDLAIVCDEKTIPMSHVTPDGNAWRAGDAALLSQQVWHRGTAHTDPRSQERIVFIVSFIGRPQHDDPRQLSRGTYFHMKWNMWGHTWQDLSDSAVSMIWPFNVLRCLHIWKPSTRAWGYDLVTAVALRMSNQQLGCEPEDVTDLVNTMNRIGLPSWLSGTVDVEDSHAWHRYISETIGNILAFLVRVNTILAAAYGIFAVISSIAVQLWRKRGGFHVLRTSIVRIIWIAAFAAGVSIYILNSVRTSKWGSSIASGVTLARPFPSQDQRWRDDPEILALEGLTSTAPERRDVLFGTRLHTASIGAYSNWIDYHPGNEDFHNTLEEVGGGRLYRSYQKGLPGTFCEEIEGRFLSSFLGRFLKQNYQNGDWIELDKETAIDYIRYYLSLGTSGLLPELKETLEKMMDRYRFGVHFRGTALSRAAQLYTRWWEERLITEGGTVEHVPSAPGLPSSLFSPSSSLPPIPQTLERHHDLSSGSNPHWISFPVVEPGLFIVGDPVWYIGPGDRAFSATILSANEDDDRYDIGFDGDATYDRGGSLSTQANVPSTLLVHRMPITVGLRVSAMFEDTNEWFSGTIHRVRPNRAVDVSYDDGDFEMAVTADRYRVTGK